MKREIFGSKLAVFFVMLGSISGASNVLGFSTITSQNGGLAFIIVHFVILFTLGFVLMTTELFIGRATKKDVVGALKTFTNKCYGSITGYLIIIISFLFLLYYSSVCGKMFSFFYKFVSNGFVMENVAAATNNSFSSRIPTILFSILFMFICGLIVMSGVKKGLERSYKILIITMLSLIVLIFIKTMTLSGASKGIALLLTPDFSKITFKAILFSIGYNFFSLSLGMGIMITMSSYFSEKIDLSNLTTYVILTELAIILLVSMSYFSFYATFIKDLSFNSLQGTQEFIIDILPKIIENMSLGYIVSIMIVSLFFVAILTSAIASMECVVAYFIGEFEMERSAASITAIIIVAILLFICSTNFFVEISFFKMNIIDTLMFLLNNVLLPVSGILVVIYLGWFVDFKSFDKQIIDGKDRTISMEMLIFLSRTIVPVMIFMLLIKGCLNFIDMFSS